MDGNGNGNLPEARDRLDQPIINAIEVKNYKQALKLVDKRLAKKQSDDFLQALRCFIQSQHPSLSERHSAAIVLQNLAEKQTAVTDLAILSLYDETSLVLFGPYSREANETLGKLRLFAVKAKSKDEKFCRSCLYACLGRDDLANSQQIAVLMEQNFSDNRHYPFWSITILTLFAQSSSCPTTQQKMYLRLAYGKIKKIAGTLAEIKDGATAPARSIQTPQELKLLHYIVQKEAGTRELLGLLQSPTLGPYSKAAKGEWEFIKAKMSAFEELQMWQELFDTCDALLSKAYTKSGVVEDTRGGDWSVWTAYMRSARKLKGQKLHLRVHEMLMAQISPDARLDKTYRRNAHLAMLTFSFKNPQPCENFTISDGENFKIGNVPTSVSALFTYLHEYAENPSAYGDVSAHIESLNTAEGGMLLRILKQLFTSKSFVLYPSEGNSEVDVSRSTIFTKRKYTTINRITSQLTVSKIIYLIKVCIPESVRSFDLEKRSCLHWTCEWCTKSCEVACKACLSEVLYGLLPIYKDSIEDKTLVGLLPTDKHPADDFYVLAATCLLKLAGFRPPLDSDIIDMDREVDLACVMQAAALLEYAASRSKVNPEIMLLLVRLYSFIGAGNLAMRVYKRLRIKQVQFDTLGYTIFDRLSSLHPYPFKQFQNELAELQEPAFLLEHHKFYRNVHGQVTKNSWRSLENGSYNTIFGLVEVSDHLETSIASVMSVLELRRINRLTRKEVGLGQWSYGFDILPRQPELVTKWHDNSDYLSFPNFELASTPRFEKYTRLGPAPSSLRSRAFLMTEKLLMLTAAASQGLTTRAGVHDEVESCISAIQKLESELLGKKVFTCSEKIMVQTSLDLFKLLHTATTSHTTGRMSPESADSIKSKLNNSILESLSKQKKSVNSVPVDQPPLFTTCLHPLYISYELATNVLTISTFKAEFLAAKSKTPFNEELLGAAKALRKAVAEKAIAMKQRTLEGGTLTYITEEVAKLQGPAFDEVWLEGWAAELVESWEESLAQLVSLQRNE